ncbi:hypothetical protein QTN93_03165 [Sphingomonas aerolata]|uniref:hypothetical protein n=1 Tax=Sphingomonas aerolata TaxID=185951 RepID=UPI003350AF53
MVDQTQIVELGLQALVEIVGLVDKLKRFRPEAANSAGPPYAILTGGHVTDIIKEVCVAQGVAFNILFDRGRRSGESPTEKEWRLKRIDDVGTKTAGLILPELANKGPRNALAHIDERYLKALLHNPDAPKVQDIAVSHWQAFSFEVKPILIRYYCFHSDTVAIFDERLHPTKLQIEADAVLERFNMQAFRNLGNGSRIPIVVAAQGAEGRAIEKSDEEGGQ